MSVWIMDRLTSVIGDGYCNESGGVGLSQFRC